MRDASSRRNTRCLLGGASEGGIVDTWPVSSRVPRQRRLRNEGAPPAHSPDADALWSLTRPRRPAAVTRQLAVIFERCLADIERPAAQPEAWVFPSLRNGAGYVASAGHFHSTPSPRPLTPGSGSRGRAKPSSL